MAFFLFTFIEGNMVKFPTDTVSIHFLLYFNAILFGT